MAAYLAHDLLHALQKALVLFLNLYGSRQDGIGGLVHAAHFRHQVVQGVVP